VVGGPLRGTRGDVVRVDLLAPHRGALEVDLGAEGELPEPSLQVAVDLDARRFESPK
jgi:hypothetical protein